MLNERVRVALFLAAIMTSPSGAADTVQSPRAVMPKEHISLFENHCFDCHDASSKEGNIDLESLSLEISQDIPTADMWAKVLNAINSGEMPPEDAEPIADADKAAFLDDLSNQMVLARKVLSDTGGVIAMRRLNRREYQNTIESLLGVRPDITSLPDDQANVGFDTSGASLFFSSDQLEQYLAVARRALELTLEPEPRNRARTVRIEPESGTTKLYAEKLDQMKDARDRAIAFLGQSEKAATDFGFLDRGQAEKQLRGTRTHMPSLVSYLERPETQHGATLISRIKTGVTKVATRQFEGGSGRELLLRVRAAAYAGVAPRYHYLEFSMRSWSNGYARPLGWRKVSGTLQDPQIIEFPVSVPAGERIQFFVHQRTHQGRGDKNLWTIHRETNPIGTAPGLWVDWMEVITPKAEGTVSEAAENIFVERSKGSTDEEYAREVITRFAARAFRTETPSNEYIEKLIGQFRAQRESGLSVRRSLVEPLSIVLASPSFLYMVESSGGSNALTDRELAVRLSYFLWSGPPDEELLKSADAGELSDPDELRDQTSRMLGDPKAERFLRDFTYQWLGLERLGMFQFQARLYPEFDNAAREAAREEIYETVGAILDQQLPLRTLLKAEFIFVNDLLADLYGIEGVEGHGFRKVRVAADSPRGGLLGSAAVLAMGSDGHRTSPVERGAWVLRHVLHDPPPPAPPNVPQISRLDGEVLSARRLQVVHQEEPQCAQCHRKIDPIGFGLENFDAAGNWRDVEAVRTGRKFSRIEEFSIDASGQLPGGNRFSDYFELRDCVAERIDDFARGLVESLIEYALGRPYAFMDRDLADAMLSEAGRPEYEMSQLIHGLVQSRQFQSK